MTYSQIVVYFIIYSFVGWVYESTFCSIMEKKPVNRGFLRGPLCPVYGVGVVVILLLATPFKDYPALVYVVSLVSVTVVEYFTGWLLETLFGMKWWDYSHNRFNIKGRICLHVSLLFGLMGLTALYLLHPPVERLVALIPGDRLRILGSLLLVALTFDLIGTLNILLGLSERLRKLQAALAEVDQLNKEYGWFDLQDVSGSLRELHTLLESRPEDARLLELVDKLEQSVAQRGLRTRRILRAYPSLNISGLENAMNRLRENWDKSKNSRKRLEGTAGRVRRQISQAFGKAREAMREALTLGRLFWTFLSAGFAGYILETLYGLIVTGRLESHQGLLYGPFNQVYGFGAVLMVLLLLPLASKKDPWLFLGGAVVGGAYEFLCSLCQELLLGTLSWDYSEQALSIGGRTSLPAMVLWGVLGVLLIRRAYPRICKATDKIPNRHTHVIGAVFTVVIAAMMATSGAAVYRWNQRVSGVPPSGPVAQLLDRQYPDQIMEEIYPNMILTGQDGTGPNA